jgi:hypothetical protein
MANQQENQENVSRDNNNYQDDTIGGASVNPTNPKEQNDTGFAGTTNAVSENHQDKDGYKLAIEDTMIGYDGNDEQMDMDITSDEDKRRSGKSGFGDND